MTTQWYWKGDKGWVEYNAATNAKLEAGFQADEKEVAVDKERFVDMKDMLQRRYDDRQKRRGVKRELVDTFEQQIVYLVGVPKRQAATWTKLITSTGGLVASNFTSKVTLVVCRQRDVKKRADDLDGALNAGVPVVGVKFFDDLNDVGHIPTSLDEYLTIEPRVDLKDVPRPGAQASPTPAAAAAAPVGMPVPAEGAVMDVSDDESSIDVLPVSNKGKAKAKASKAAAAPRGKKRTKPALLPVDSDSESDSGTEEVTTPLPPPKLSNPAPTKKAKTVHTPVKTAAKPALVASLAKFGVVANSVWKGESGTSPDEMYALTLCVDSVSDSGQFTGSITWHVSDTVEAVSKYDAVSSSGTANGDISIELHEHTAIKNGDDLDLPTTYTLSLAQHALKGTYAADSGATGPVSLACDPFAAKSTFSGVAYSPYAFTLTVTERQGDKVMGTVNWPGLGASTRFEGLVDSAGKFTFTETEALKGSADVELNAKYECMLEQAADGIVWKGSMMDSSGTSGTFSMSRQ